MRRAVLLWVLAVLVTVGSAVWQRMTGPTYPLGVDVAVAGHEVTGDLLRSATIDENVPVRLEAPGPVDGEVAWRRWPTDEPWKTVPMARDGEQLVAELPGQPVKAAKIEYRVTLRAQGEETTLATRLRFKGAVPDSVLAVHILAMFFGMLFSFRAGLEALVRGPGLGWLTVATLICLGAGGLMLGPIVQQYAFDAYWTGWPVGEDLTDNKLAAAVLFWVIAAWQQRRGRPIWSVVAAIVTFVIFVVPHSLHGSTHDWETGEHIQAALKRFLPLA
ncbi:hypothetical protein GF314_01805 [bacterium]|nr:hypothetical protein [bacterium]